MAALSIAASAWAGPVNLNTWTAESYPAVSGFGAGVWTVSGGGTTVFQSVNGQPTIFYSDFLAYNTMATGQITVSGGDDDFMGFVFGFDPGDTSSASADYLLVDWKRNSQNFDFATPSLDPGGVAPVGLAVSRVTGIPTADEFWQHATLNVCCGAGGLVELARGATLGNTGWVIGTTYSFTFIFTPTQFSVSVDGVPQFSIVGAFANGRMGFYNFSQAGVTYNAFTIDPAPDVIPEPTTLLLVGTGLVAAGIKRRRRRN